MKFFSKHLFTFIFFILLLTACNKENKIKSTGEFHAPVLKGFELRDELGNSLGSIGSPNVKNELNVKGLNYKLSFFPNPAIGEARVIAALPSTVIDKQIWIVEGDYNGSFSSTIDYPSWENMKVGGFPLLKTELTSNIISINLSKLKKGYYRIYLKADNELLYDNIIIE